MTNAAQDHVDDIAPKGLVQSLGSDGSHPQMRLAKYGRLDETWGESCIYGALNTREVLERLIVCDGQPKRGFRASVFSDDLKMCGIATGKHESHQNMIQLEYVNKLLVEGEMPTINIANPEALDKKAIKNIEKIGLSSKNLR